MSTSKPTLKLEVDYRKLRLKNLTSPEFSHLLLLLFWPLFGLAFLYVERFREASYFIVYSPLDDKIPFCEFFLIPYLFWFLYLVGMYVYCLFYDIEAFRNYTYFIILTYTAAILIYLLWPTAQELRPVAFERDNLFTRFIRSFYDFDTNTNVCPSIHVIGAVAVSAAAWNSKLFSKTGWRIAFSVATLLISASTVFLKQHSILDLPPAFAICAVAYPFVFCKRFRAKISAAIKKPFRKRKGK